MALAVLGYALIPWLWALAGGIRLVYEIHRHLSGDTRTKP